MAKKAFIYRLIPSMTKISMTIKNKIILLATSLILLTVGFFVTGIVGLNQVHKAEGEGEFADKIQDSFQELRILFEQNLMGPHDYLIHGNIDEKRIFLEDYKNLIVKMNSLKRQIKNNKDKYNPDSEKALKNAENKLLLINEKLPEFKIKVLEIFGLEFPKETNSYKAGFYMEEMDLFSRGLENDLKDEGKVLLKLSDQARDRIRAIHSHVDNLFILFGLVSLFIGITLSYYLIQSITCRIDGLIKTSRKIQGGDLTIRAEVLKNDEICELASSFNKMVDELVNTQEYISSILQGSGDAMCVIDKDFTILKTNNQMRKLIGKPDEEILYKKCYEHHCGKLCRTEGCVLKRILRGEDRVELETVKGSKHSGNIPVDLIATPLKRGGEVIGVIESFRDISGRKRIEKEIRRAHEDLNQIFNTSVPLSVIDKDYTIIRVNNTFCDYFALTPDETIGKKCYDIWGNQSCHTPQCAIKKILNDEERCEYEINKHLDDGRDISCLVTAVSYKDLEGNIIGIVENFTDLTEKKKMERDVINLQKLESIGILAGGIAHDFNNILTPIVGNINLMMIYTDAKDKTFEFLQEAEKATKQAKMLTQQLLTFAKGGAPIMKTASIQQIIEEQVTFALRGSNSKSSFFIADDLWPVKIDEGQIGRVINNLIINADQAMPEGGTIKIQAENVTLGPEQIVSLVEGEYVKLTIEDQGVGISPNYLDKIFDPYFTTKQQGSGLGLATCYSIVKRHNGHITAESQVGIRTAFHIYLPASEKKIQKNKDKDMAPIPGKGKVLVMDDERAIRVLAANMLKMLGYEVQTAEDGFKAVELYTKARESDCSFDAVIIDLTVPGGMGGKETIKKLLEIDPGVKAIIASGYSNKSIMADYQKFGFKGVISKPYQMQQLSELLHSVIS